MPFRTPVDDVAVADEDGRAEHRGCCEHLHRVAPLPALGRLPAKQSSIRLFRNTWNIIISTTNLIEK